MTNVWRSQVPGPLAPYEAGYRLELARLGYTPASTEYQVWVMAHLSRWLFIEGVGVAHLTPDRVEQFLTVQRVRTGRRLMTGRVLRPLLGYFRFQNLLPPVTEVTPTPMDDLLGRYRRYMIEQRGLAPRTVRHYESVARRFLNERMPAEVSAADLRRLTGVDVSAFLRAEVSRLTARAAKNYADWLRPFLRFLHIEGLIATPLAAAMPPVASWRDAQLPATLTPTQVTAMLDHCDRSQVKGRRDFAILLLLARLGLRTIEVTRLELGDIDWRVGEAIIRGKGRRYDRLPLPVDVGEGLAAYLRNGRPRTDSRSLFITHRAPLRGIEVSVVSQVVRSACRRAGIPLVGAHRLRHALASEMLRQGLTLPEIGQVLRHRDFATTAIYAKVDRGALASVVQPWPGAGR